MGGINRAAIAIGNEEGEVNGAVEIGIWCKGIGAICIGGDGAVIGCDCTSDGEGVSVVDISDTSEEFVGIKGVWLIFWCRTA